MKTFFWWKNSKFPTFKRYIWSQKMLYHQRYSADFKKTFHLLKDVENRYLRQKVHGRSYFRLAMVRWKLLQKKNLKFPTFQAAHCARKNAISPKVFNRFSKTFLLLKDVENRYSGQEFHGRSYFSFAMVGWKLFSGGKIRNFPLSSCTLCHKKCYITKGIQPIFKKLSIRWKMWKIGIRAKNFMGATILALQW